MHCEWNNIIIPAACSFLDWSAGLLPALLLQILRCKGSDNIFHMVMFGPNHLLYSVWVTEV